jgi:hypothetical protein
MALVLGALTAPSPALADTYTGNLAGRPISGKATQGTDFSDPNVNSGTSGCAGLAYADVNGKMALLTAGHCMGDTHAKRLEAVGKTVKSPVGTTLGEWGPLVNNIDNHDLGYIKLYEGNWPSVRNQVYRGAVPGDDWWTITAMPGLDLKCSDLEDEFGLDIYQNYQYEIWPNPTTTPYRTGVMTGYVDPVDNGHCTVATSLQIHGFCCIDSGTPWVLQGATNTVFGIGTGRWCVGCDVETDPTVKIQLTPLYKGINNLNEYWVAHGQNIGAWLCQTATCGGIGGYDP